MSSSPTRKSPYGLSPKKKMNIPLNNDEFETTLEKSFEIFDSNLESSLWFNVRMAGKLPEKRSNHASFIYKHSSSLLDYMYMEGLIFRKILFQICGH